MKAVIFDLDGTLADTLSGIAHFVNRTTAAYGLSSLSQDRVKGFVGNGAKILGGCCGTTPEHIKALRTIF